MGYKLTICCVLMASLAYAKDVKNYRTGKVLQRESVACVADDQNTASAAGNATGKAVQKKMPELSCREYVLQADRVIYRIRPIQEQHAARLSVGEQIQFRFEKDTFLLRAGLLSSRDREYAVVSTTPRGDDEGQAKLRRVNHLQ